MRYAAVFVLVVTLLMASLTPSVEGTGDGGRALQDGVELIGGAPWSPDLRVTYHREEDTMPQVTADADGNAHIVWRRSGMWTRTFDNTGIPLSKEVFITPHMVTGYGSPDRYPMGPSVAIDSEGCIHVTWDDGWQNVYYQKFDPYGNVLTDVIHVGNEDNTASHMPSIAVDPVNDHVHIVHEDYEYQCEDIVYDKLSNSGKVLVNEVAVSSDVSAHCEHSTLAPDVLGFIHVAFGTSMGAMWRKVDHNGVARGISLNIFPAPLYMIPDLAVTPNGDVHLVWSDANRVHYTRMDHNGTVLDGDIAICDTGIHVGAPRIAAAHDENTVYIVWHDYRHGNAEVFYAKMVEGQYGVPPDNHRLTDDPAGSLYPRVALDPGDGVHVVWGDRRDGNSEIYYKFMYNYEMDMASLWHGPYPYFFHPNQTKRLGLYIENEGTLPDGYEVTLSHDEWAVERGWSLHLDTTEFLDVPAGGRVFFNLSMTSPVSATTGDFINVTLTATSLSSISVNVTLTWRSFIIVEKGVSIKCKEPTKLIDPGGTVLFDLEVTNIGDVPDTYIVEHTLVPDDEGWEVTMDAGPIALNVGEAMPVPVHLTAPEGVMTDVNGTVFVRVSSTSDSPVWDSIRLRGLVNPIFHLEMATPVTTRWVDPGDSVDFPITIENMGTVHVAATVFLTSSCAHPAWSAYLQRETVFLGGGESRVIVLTVAAPENALAGYRQGIKVNAVSEDHTSSGDLEVMAIANQIHSLDLAIDSVEMSIDAGEIKTINLLSVTNNGNGNEGVLLKTAPLPKGWMVSYELDGQDVRNLMIPPKATLTVGIIATAPLEASAGRHPFELIVLDEADREYPLHVFVKVHQRFGAELSTTDYHAEGPPGSAVSYLLTLNNEGNGDDTFVLEHSGLPDPRWVAGFYDLSGRPVERVELSSGEQRTFELRVRIPEDVDGTQPVDITARATSEGAEVDDIKLTLDVRMPDLGIMSVEYVPAHGSLDRPNLVTVWVENAGTYRADNVIVVLSEDGRVVGRESVRTINPGDVAFATFSWTPSSARTSLTFRVSCDDPEPDHANNELTHRRSFDEPGSGNGLWAWLAILVLACIVLWLHLVGRREVGRGKAR